MPSIKRFWVISAGVLILLIALLVISGIGSAPDIAVTPIGYENRIFNTDRIHSIHIYTEDWDSFLQTCIDKKYTDCSVIINDDRLDHVGIRALEDFAQTAVSETGSCRYSLELAFDHYDTQQSYHGLDKLILNNLIQDNTMMKDYLSYQLMRELGAAAPLCSYTTVYVNGKSLGLYLAVEAIEESFLQRNYGSDHGELYKPDAEDGDPLRDVKLQYIDDDPDSYPNIFDNAKTDITPEDKVRLIRALKRLSTGKKLKNVLDREAVIRYFAVHTFVCNEDSYTGSTAHNYCLYEKDGRLTMLPGDYHLAFGGISAEDASAVINSSIYSPVPDSSYTDRPMLAWILENKNYTWLYGRYHTELLKVDMEALVERTANMIAPYVQRDPTRFCTYEEYEAGVEALKQFLSLRSESIRLQLSEKSADVDVGDLDLSAMGGIRTNSPSQAAQHKEPKRNDP